MILVVWLEFVVINGGDGSGGGGDGGGGNIKEPP